MPLLAQAAGDVLVPGYVAAIVALLGLAGLIGGAWAVARQAAIRSSLSTIIEANAELRTANEDLRRELSAEREARAELAGRLDAVTTHLAEQLVEAVVRTVERMQAGRSPESRSRSTDVLGG